MKLLTPLLPQQIAAVEKLQGLKVGALFMEMGTGKTRTALELIKRKMDRGKFEQVLWLCPCSVKNNLRADIIKHTGEMPSYIKIEGIESISASGRIYMENVAYVQKRPTMMIVDESNMVKNPWAIRSKRIVNLSEICKYKLILNGTPVSKNEADLFNQFYILDPRILGYQSYYGFAANHLVYKEVKTASGRKVKTDQVVRVLNVDYLAERIAPYTYQIKKEECMTLPEKHYHAEGFNIDSEQDSHYGYTKMYYLSLVDDFDSSTIYRLFTALQHVTSGRHVTEDDDGHMITRPMYDDPLKNPRVECLKDVLEDDIKGEQVIIFAKYDYEIDDIITLLKSEEIPYVEFTGRVKPKQRLDNLEQFRGGVQVMIANKRCGAYGLNLQFCHNIIFYSNDFDFATRLQAEDRIHRLGQEQECHIYDILASATIDTFISDNLDGKGSMLSAMKREIQKWKNKKSPWEIIPKKELKKVRKASRKYAKTIGKSTPKKN